MFNSNTIITKKNGELIYIGNRLLQYINMANPTPFAYPSGHLCKDDMLIFCTNDCSSLTFDDRASIKSYGVDSLPDEGLFLMIAIYNSYLSPIYKSHKQEKDSDELLNTIYNHQQILIKCHENKLTIHINKQLVESTFSKSPYQLIIYNNRGITHYCSDNNNLQPEALSDILACKPFNYYYEKLILENDNYSINNIFNSDFKAIITMLKCNDMKLVKYRHKNLSIKKYTITSRDFTLYEYSVFSEEDMVYSLNSLTDDYIKLNRQSIMESDVAPFSLNFPFYGNDEKIQKIKHLISKSCITNTTVLLTGESGTGKTFMAKNIHYSSPRSSKPFIHVNCAAISSNLIESELFGYEAGSFTGAKNTGKPGYFELADSGTLFLDEIGEIPYHLQSKLLDVIQSKSFYRVGGTKEVKTDIRLIAATNKDLPAAIENKEFREDLYYRINIFPIELPPLRERLTSLHFIIADLLPRICSSIEIEPVLVSVQAINKMKRYCWPGNIRELENVLEKAAILCDGNIILPDDIVLPDNELIDVDVNSRSTLKNQLAEVEKEIILDALKKYNGERNKVAECLGIGRTSLFEKIRKYNIVFKAGDK